MGLAITLLSAAESSDVERNWFHRTIDGSTGD